MFNIVPDKERAKSLLREADSRIKELHKIRRFISTSRVVEFYFDCIKELILALMYIEGIKSLSHKELIEFVEKYLDSEESAVLNELRIKGNEVSYYGKEISTCFFIQKEDILKKIIKKLKELIKKELR